MNLKSKTELYRIICYVGLAIQAIVLMLIHFKKLYFTEGAGKSSLLVLMLIVAIEALMLGMIHQIPEEKKEGKHKRLLLLNIVVAAWLIWYVKF